jgi:S-(hydroxymethyl)glutathione dehydrogenase / alcohol dehydrogenase
MSPDRAAPKGRWLCRRYTYVYIAADRRAMENLPGVFGAFGDRRMRGLVWDGRTLHLTDTLEVRAPGPGEVRVRILRSGICHSDVNAMDSGEPGLVVLGHEAAGVISELGEGVTDWQLGEPVVAVSWTPCGHCRECDRGSPAGCDETFGIIPNYPFKWNGELVKSFANVASFASEIVVKTRQLARTYDLPPEQAALIGCAVTTGYAAAQRIGEVRAGDRVVVLGVGGIGVNAIQSARLAGASVLAVDINPAKEEVARRFGAEQFLCVSPKADGGELAEAIQRAFAPVDVAIECSGAISAISGAAHAVKRNGRAVLVGMSLPGRSVELSVDALVYGRSIVAELGAGALEDDVPRLVNLVREGRLEVASQVTKIWPLEEATQAIEALRKGEVVRAMLDHTI